MYLILELTQLLERGKYFFFGIINIYMVDYRYYMVDYRYSQPYIDIDNIDNQPHIDIDNIDNQPYIDIDNDDNQPHIDIDNQPLTQFSGNLPVSRIEGNVSGKIPISSTDGNLPASRLDNIDMSTVSTDNLELS